MKTYDKNSDILCEFIYNDNSIYMTNFNNRNIYTFNDQIP